MDVTIQFWRRDVLHLTIYPSLGEAVSPYLN